jgi:hypothetical protein
MKKIATLFLIVTVTGCDKFVRVRGVVSPRDAPELPSCELWIHKTQRKTGAYPRRVSGEFEVTFAFQGRWHYFSLVCDDREVFRSPNMNLNDGLWRTRESLPLVDLGVIGKLDADEPRAAPLPGP